MTNKYLLSLLIILAAIACNKENQNDIYLVNGSKMVGLTGNNWSSAASALQNKTGYQYTPSPASTGIKAEVHLPALDDSTRAVKGTVLLNIALDNRVQFAMFNADPVAQPVAYAMMLNYHHATLQTITGITSSMGGVIENGIGTNTPVSTVLSKLTNGQPADQLAITYSCAQGGLTMVVFKQGDGRYIFSYRGML